MEVPLEQPVRSAILIGTHMQQLIYKGENFLYKFCGRLGHTGQSFTHQKSEPSTHAKEGPRNITSTLYPQDHWQTVSFTTRRGAEKYKPGQQGPMREEPNLPRAGINAKLFDAATGKYLNTQELVYKSKTSSNSTTHSTLYPEIN